jgi:MFS family permease
MTRVYETTIGTILEGFRFFNKQNRDWKVTVTRSNITIFLYQMVLPYVSIYILALGATGTQLGIVNSIGMAIAGISGPLSGWLIDKTGIKKVYLFGIVLVAVSYLIYGLAQSWPIIIIALILYWLGNNTSIQGCEVICANGLKSNERATGMSICETFGMGLLGLAAPLIGAALVTSFGGINVEGIRPLFFICLAGIGVTFFLILTQLSNHRWGTIRGASLNFFQGFSQVFKEGHNLKRMLVLTSLTGLEIGAISPYVQPFAHQFKGADQFVLGAMVTASALVPLLLGIPLGRLSDRIGRKKVIYIVIPLILASYLTLIFAQNSGFLISSGALQGFIMINAIITTAMARELVPPEQMGRWTGIMIFFRMLFGAGLVYLSGIIWDNVGPIYVFVVVMAINLARIPLLIGMPETLGSRVKTTA